MYKNILRLREEDAAFAAQLAALSEDVGSIGSTRNSYQS